MRDVSAAISAILDGAAVPVIAEAMMRMGMGAPPPVNTGATGEAEDRKHAAWIEPNGRTHVLGREEIHGDWATARPEMWPKRAYAVYRAAAGRGDDTYHDESRQMSRMMKAGWVRKAGAAAYHVHAREQIPRVLAHVRRWHPDVDEFHVDVGSPKIKTTVTMNAHTGWPVRR